MEYIYSPFAKTLALSLGLAVAGLSTHSSQAGTIYWDGGSANWDAATNWSTVSGATTPDPGSAPGIGDDVVFNITTANGAETISLNGNQAANTLTFNNTGATTISSTVADQTLTLASGITVNTGAGAVTIGSATAANRTNVILGTAGANQAWTLNGATNMTVTNGVAGTASSGNTQTLTITGSSTGGVTFTGNTTAITDGTNGGKLALVLNGSATTGNYLGLSLNSANSYSGGTTITQGRVGTANALAFGAVNSLVTVQGTTDGGPGGQAFLLGVTWLYDFNISGFGNNETNEKYALRMLNNTIIGASTNTFTIANAAAIGTLGGSGFTIASKITGTGALTIRRGSTSGVTTATFTNANNDYSGQTNLENAILQLNASTAAQNSIINTGAGTTNVLKFGNGITAATIGGLAGTGAGALSLLNNLSGAVALTVGNNNNTGMSYSGVLSGAGASLIKTGTGTQTLSGASTYTGSTTINGGTLALSGTGSINSTSSINIAGSNALFLQNSATALTVPVTVTTGTLAGSGTASTVTVVSGSGGVISNGNGSNSATFTIGSLTFSGTGAITLNIAASATALVVSTLTTTGSNGLVVLSGSGLFINGANNLITFGTFNGSLSDFAIGTFAGFNGRQTAGAVVLSGDTIALNVLGDLPVWTGSNGGLWRTGTTGVVGGTPAWALKTTGAPTDFWVGDTVEFNDSVNLNGTFIAPLTTTATITGGSVSPGQVTFNNNGLAYTITSNDGSGIAGTSGLLMNGTNSVTLSTSNSYTGPTVVNNAQFNLVSGGSIRGTAITVGTGGSLTEDGTSTIQGASSLSSGGIVTLSGSNNYTGATAITSGSLRLRGTGALGNTAINVAAAGTLREGGTSTIYGTSSITSAGTVVLNGSNTYTGATNVTGGTFSLSSTSALVGTAITVGTGATFIEDATSIIAGGVGFTTSGATTLSGSNAYTGTTNVLGGMLTVTGTLGSGTVTVGGTNGIPVLNIGAGASLGTGVGSIFAGNNGAATANAVINQAAGSTVRFANLILGFSVAAAQNLNYANYNVNNGTINEVGFNRFRIGASSGTNSVAIMTITGSSAVSAVDGIALNDTAGTAAGSNGFAVLYINGSTLTGSNASISLGIGGRLGQSEMTITGTSSVILVGPTVLGGSVAGTPAAGDTGRIAILNLGSGSILETTGVSQSTLDAPFGYLNFLGGTLQAQVGATSPFLGGVTQAMIFRGGATIDNNGQAITVSQAISSATGQGLTSIAVTGGTGYVGLPYVQITGGGATTPATAIANKDSNGNITSITITNPGTGYTSTPTISLIGGGGGGASLTPALTTLSTGTMTLVGSGTTIFTGANTYTGPTVVSQGTLQLGANLPSTAGITIAAGATLRSPGSFNGGGVLNSSGLIDMTDGIAQTLTVGGLAFNASSLNLDILDGISDSIASTGAASISGNNVINLLLPTGQTVTTGTYILLTASGGLGSGFSLGSVPTNTFTFSLANSTASQEILIVSGKPVPATAYWTGRASASGTNPANQWSFGVAQALGTSNWSTTRDGLTDPQQVPGSTTNVIMTASNAVGVAGTLNTQLDSQYSIKSLTFDVPASPGISNVVIDTNGNIIVIGSGGVTLAATSAASGQFMDTTGTGSILLTQSELWANNSNTQSLVINDPITPNVSGTTTFTIGGTGSGGFTLGGAINNGNSGVLALVLNQAGITQINGANNYSGGTTLVSGTVQLGNTSALGLGPITFSAGSTVDLQLNGLGSGGGNLQVADLNTNLANPGSVIIESGTTTGVIDTLAISISGSDVFAGSLRDGSGGVLALSTAGSGTLRLTGSNSYSGGTTILGNGVQINSSANIGSLVLPSSIILSSGTLETLGNSFDLGANKSIQPISGGASGIQVDGGTLTISGTIFNNLDSGNLLKTGTGNLIVSGPDSHSGNWAVTAGNLFLTNSNNSFGGVIQTSAGTILNVASLSDYGVNSAIGNRAAGSETNVATDSVSNGIGIHITGGTLQYTGSTAQSTNRQIRLGVGTDTIDASGSVPSATIGFTYTGTNTNLFDTAGARTLNLTGNNTGNNTFGIGLTDQAAGTGLTSILKSGPGTWKLTGSNTNTGATVITGGILRMGVNNTLGSLANIGSISAGATLDLNDTNQTIALFSGTSAGQITNQGVGTGILTVSGTAPGTYAGNLVDNTGKVGLTLNSAGGTLTLTGSTAISGPVTITSGTLAFPKPGASIGAVNLGGTNAMLRVRAISGGVQPLLNTRGLTVGQSGNSTLQINLNNLTAVSGTLISTGTGGLTIGGPTVIALQNALNLANGTLFTAIDYSGALVGNFLSLSVGAPGGGFPLRDVFSLVNNTTNTSIDVSVQNDGPVWTGTMVSGSGTRNWDIDNVGNNSVGTLNWQTITSGSSTTYRQIASGTDAVLFSDLASASATNVNIVTQVSPFAITVNSNTNNYTFSGVGGIAGAGSLMKAGNSTLVITTSNSYTGATTISGGVLQLGDGITDGSINSSVNIVDNGSLIYNRLGTFTYSGIISGSGSVTKTGPGQQSLSGANTFTGGVTISSGTLAAGNASALGSGNAVNFTAGSNATLVVGGNALSIADINGDSTATITNLSATAGSLIMTGTGNDVFNGVITNGTTGTLGLTRSGGGSLTLGGSNNFTGATLISAGTLSLQHANAINGSALTIGPNATLVEGVDNAISGGSSLTVQSSLSLSNSNSYTGNTTINSGTGVTLTVTNRNGAGNGSEFVAANGATAPIFKLHIDGGGAINMPNSFGGNSLISTTIDVDNNGGGGTNGVITLTATNSNYGGGDTLNVTGGNGYSLALAGITNTAGASGATTTFNPTSANLTIGFLTGGPLAGNSFALGGTSGGNAVTGAIVNSGTIPLSIIKSNSSTWTLSGVSTYTGTTSITGGRLVVTGSLSGTTVVSVGSGATLNDNGVINAATTITNNGGRVSGQGTLGSVAITGGTLAPGFSVVNSGIGTLTSLGTVTLDSASAFSIRLGVSSPFDNDRLAPTNLLLNGASLQLTLGPGFVPTIGASFVIVVGGAGATGTGINKFAQGSSITLDNGTAFNIFYAAQGNGSPGGNNIVLIETAIPEPGTWAMLIGGLGILSLWRKRIRTS